MAEQQGHKTNFLEQGVMFEEKYRIVRELGRGGFGMVYLAYQQQMDRHVAIKVLKSGMGDVHRSAKERFLREVKIISKLRHPNTVTIHDFGESAEGVLYMVLEFIEGKTVKQILKYQGAQPPQRALAWTGQMARSLAEAHRYGVIHRDLKPANVMVTDLETESDFVKVLDFGIARLLRTDERDLTSIGLPEGERELIGTPRYMSPEQVRGESLGPASDVYSVGLILYEMLVGQPAVQGDTTMALISQQISSEPLHLDGLRALPPGLADLIRAATAKRLERRFSDAETFGEAIEQTLITLGGPPPGSASARQSGRFRSVDRSARFQSGNQTPGPQQHTGRFGPSGSNPSVPNPSGPNSSGPNPSSAGPSASSAHRASAPQRPAQQPPTQQPPTQQRPDQQPPDQQLPAQQPPEPTAHIVDHHRASPFQGNNIHEFHEEPHELDRLDELDEPVANLPPPPSDTNPFEIPVRDPQPSKTIDSTVPAHEESSTARYLLDFVRVTLFALVAAVGLYVAFLVVSPIFGHFLSGTAKLIASLILASAIPLLTALGENSKRERFEVIENPYDRVVRVFVGTAIFSFGTAVICALAMSGAVVTELRSFPNWFLSDSQRQSSFGEFNSQVSLGLAQVVEEATSAIGIYEGKSHGDTRTQVAPVKPNFAKPPAPTRPSTKAKQKREETPPDEPAQAPGSAGSPGEPSSDETPSANPPAGDRSKPGDDGEYIRW